jgi:hypothetical protein
VRFKDRARAVSRRSDRTDKEATHSEPGTSRRESRSLCGGAPKPPRMEKDPRIGILTVARSWDVQVETTSRPFGKNCVSGDGTRRST